MKKIALTLVIGFVGLMGGTAVADNVWYKPGHLSEFAADRDACAATAGIRILDATHWQNGSISDSQKAAWDSCFKAKGWLWVTVNPAVAEELWAMETGQAARRPVPASGPFRP
jgi:hypothetical protein